MGRLPFQPGVQFAGSPPAGERDNRGVEIRSQQRYIFEIQSHLSRALRMIESAGRQFVMDLGRFKWLLKIALR
jgi:hypothetical protein